MTRANAKVLAAAVLALAVAAGCSRGAGTAADDAGIAASSTSPAASHLDAAAARVPSGKPFDLRVTAATVTYCDDVGAWRYEAVTDSSLSVDQTCAPEEDADSTCGCGGKQVTVRTPGFGPIDVVDTPDGSYTLAGRVHDCACVGETIYVLTETDIFALTRGKKPHLVTHAPRGERMGASPSWVAWTDGKKVHVIKPK